MRPSIRGACAEKAKSIQMRNKGKKATTLSVVIAASLLIMLLLAGTILRMRTDGLGFGEAFVSFAGDTFRPNAAQDRLQSTMES